MTSKDEEIGDGEGLSGATSSLDISPSEIGIGPSGAWASQDTMKRAAAKKLIERYFYQLTDGCGNSSCENEHCASSGKLKDGLTPNQAAGLAIQLFRQEARLCDAHPTKIARTHNDFRETSNNEEKKTFASTTNTQESSSKYNTINKAPPKTPHLTEARLLKVLETCQAENSYALLIRTLGEVYSAPDSLGRSFLKSDSSPLDAYAPSQLAAMKKEEVRELEGEQEKDQDSVEIEKGEVESSSDNINIDLASLRRAYQQLFSLSGNLYENALVQALVTLSGSLKFSKEKFADLEILKRFCSAKASKYFEELPHQLA